MDAGRGSGPEGLAENSRKACGADETAQGEMVCVRGVFGIGGGAGGNGRAFFFADKEESKKYAQEELRAASVKWDFFSAACEKRGFLLPDSENYFIDFVSATAFYLEDELYALEAKYDYNWGVGVRIYLTDKENLEVKYFLEEIPIDSWIIDNVPISYQFYEDYYYCMFNVKGKRYYLTIKGLEPDVVNVLRSILGQNNE